jgi:hemerythrin-like domain-containing protein
MDHQAIPGQVLMEHEMLTHLSSALRTALGWRLHGDLSRNLSSVRFVLQSFQRHLEHLMALEEHDGYMDVVLESHPTYCGEVETLRHEHDQFRKSLQRASARLEHLDNDDFPRFEMVCDELRALLERIDHHSGKEIDLIQRALVQDEGGQG